MNYKEKVTSILKEIEKPVRYIGNEVNSYPVKENADIRFAFFFPDIYEIGMSHLGMKILYEMLNETDDIMCERVFAPDMNMAKKLRENNIPLFTLESFSPVEEFDFIGVTIQYEMCLTTMLMMFDLGNIPFLSKDRDESYPIVMAGGPCTVNPMPFKDFFDVILIGEGEYQLIDIMEIYKKCESRDEFLKKIRDIEGVYVPKYDDDENGKMIRKVKKTIVEDMNECFSIKKPIVPFVSPVHDRISLEVMRGCRRGCRFCQAGMIYRPVRQKSLGTIKKQADELIKNTGYEEISLTSLSSTDYMGCMDTIKYLIDEYRDKKINVSLPSLRMDTFSMDLAKTISKVKKTSMTFAPEAGSQRMRNIINKNLSEEEILTTIEEVYKSGYSKLKLYFMLGLPYETKEDIEAIAKLCEKIIEIYYSIDKKKRGRPFSLTISTSCFVPKAFTPFQWFSQDRMEILNEKQQYLKSILPKKVKYHYHDSRLSMLEAVLAKGDERLSLALIKAYENGCVFDSWNEYFKFDEWVDALKECDIDAQDYASRPMSYEDKLPWDNIDIGVTKEFLINENEKAKKEMTTPDCKSQCSACGISTKYGRCDFEI